MTTDTSVERPMERAAAQPAEGAPDGDWLRRRWQGPHRHDVSLAWSAGGTALVPVGVHWDVIEAPLHPSIEALSLLRRPGPLLVCPRSALAWWPVPLGASARWQALPGYEVRSTGAVLRVPAQTRYADGLGWLEPPDGSGRLTPAADLRTAFDELRKRSERP